MENTTDHTSGNASLRFYRNNIDPNGTASDAYGYWIAVFGIILSIIGVFVFLWGSTFTPGGEAYWAYRQAGIVLAATGVPLSMFGISIRLHVHPAATALGGLGFLVAVAGIIWFVILYPNNWTFVGQQDVYLGQRQVILTYMAGIVLLAGGYTILPVMADPVTRDSPLEPQSYYELLETGEGWRWRLFEDETVIARSSEPFTDPQDARTAIDDFSIAAPVAGIEIRYPEAGNDQ